MLSSVLASKTILGNQKNGTWQCCQCVFSLLLIRTLHRARTPSTSKNLTNKDHLLLFLISASALVHWKQLLATKKKAPSNVINSSSLSHLSALHLSKNSFTKKLNKQRPTPLILKVFVGIGMSKTTLGHTQNGTWQCCQLIFSLSLVGPLCQARTPATTKHSKGAAKERVCWSFIWSASWPVSHWKNKIWFN